MQDLPLPAPDADPADRHTDLRWFRVGLAAWAVAFVGVVTYCLAHLGKHTVSTTYWAASRDWWAGREMYGSKAATLEGIHGFLYFPQAAVLFSPFAYLPLAVAELSWRALSMALAAWSLWRVCALLAGPNRTGRWFGIASLLSVMIYALSATNGQANLLVIAAMTLATIEVFHRRWWPATAWLILAVALKPHAAALILLLFVCHTPMRWRLIVGGVALAALPWINPDWAYVLEQHASFIEKTRRSASPPAGHNHDVVGLFWSAGVELPPLVWTAVRLAGAAATLALAILAHRRFPRLSALVYTLSFAVLFIVLLNPRSEGPTHAMTGLAIGVFGAFELMARRRVLGAAFIVAAIVMAFCHELIKAGDGIAARWPQPLLDLALAGYLIVHVARGRSRIEAVPRVPSGTPEPGVVPS